VSTMHFHLGRKKEMARQASDARSAFSFFSALRFRTKHTYVRVTHFLSCGRRMEGGSPLLLHAGSACMPRNAKQRRVLAVGRLIRDRRQRGRRNKNAADSVTSTQSLSGVRGFLAAACAVAFPARGLCLPEYRKE
jgi:hypothetical protein